MEKIKNLLIKILYVVIFFGIFLGLPYYLGSNYHLWWSWFAAIIVINFFNDNP